jgi:hypothetical protein
VRGRRPVRTGFEFVDLVHSLLELPVMALVPEPRRLWTAMQVARYDDHGAISAPIIIDIGRVFISELTSMFTSVPSLSRAASATRPRPAGGASFPLGHTVISGPGGHRPRDRAAGGAQRRPARAGVPCTGRTRRLEMGVIPAHRLSLRFWPIMVSAQVRRAWPMYQRGLGRSRDGATGRRAFGVRPISGYRGRRILN